jgi:RHS repeat-associated protein
MKNRSFSAANYRFGFNGKEQDGETASDAYDFGARIYDARLGRWLAVDPLYSYYSYSTPYAGNGNSPIICKDVDGKRIQIKIGENTYVEYYNGKLYKVTPDGRRSNSLYTGNHIGALKTMELLNILSKTSTGLEIVNFVQSHYAIQTIEIISGENRSENNTENEENPYLKFNFKDEMAFTTNGLEVQPLHIKLGHELTHFMGKYIDTRKQSQYKMWSERGEARYTEVFATHYENMLRAEFNLNLRSSYIYILFGNAYGLDEETSILNSDKRTSRYYPAYQDIQLNMDRDEEDPFRRAYLGNIQFCIRTDKAYDYEKHRPASTSGAGESGGSEAGNSGTGKVPSRPLKTLTDIWD